GARRGLSVLDLEPVAERPDADDRATADPPRAAKRSPWAEEPAGRCEDRPAAGIRLRRPAREQRKRSEAIRPHGASFGAELVQARRAQRVGEDRQLLAP